MVNNYFCFELHVGPCTEFKKKNTESSVLLSLSKFDSFLFIVIILFIGYSVAMVTYCVRKQYGPQ